MLEPRIEGRAHATRWRVWVLRGESRLSQEEPSGAGLTKSNAELQFLVDLFGRSRVCTHRVRGFSQWLEHQLPGCPVPLRLHSRQFSPTSTVTCLFKRALGRNLLHRLETAMKNTEAQKAHRTTIIEVVPSISRMTASRLTKCVSSWCPDAFRIDFTG